MEESGTIDDRLRQSSRILRAWLWMVQLTSDPEIVAELLLAEARALIALGRKHPSHARQIGQLIVAYHRLITRLRHRPSSPEIVELAV